MEAKQTSYHCSSIITSNHSFSGIFNFTRANPTETGKNCPLMNEIINKEIEIHNDMILQWPTNQIDCLYIARVQQKRLWTHLI